MILRLFDVYQQDPTSLPPRFAERVPEQGAQRVICDYVAGMTDRFCMAEHSRLVRARGSVDRPTSPPAQTTS
jgi:dGTPase